LTLEERNQSLPPTARWVLGTAFLGLLALMLGSGIVALRDLEEMHREEQTARQKGAERSLALSGLCLSIQIYTETAQRYAMASSPPEGADALAQMERLKNEIASGFAGFEGSGQGELGSDLGTIRRLFERQQELFDTLFSWPAPERRRRAPEWIEREIAPVQFRILESSDAVRILSGRRLRDTDQALLAQFSQLQGSLTRSIVVALSSALLLILASMAYILRLERQTRARYGEIARSRGELEMLSARLVDAQEEERRRISRELHDEVGQTLGALLVDFGRLSAALGESAPHLKEQVDQMKGLAERTVRAVRNLALLLRPSMLDDLGLVAALDWQGREVSRTSQIEVDVQAENVSDDLPNEYKVCIYRLVQEALNNAVRHSAARNARVRLEQAGDRILVSVSDDGHGFDPVRSRGIGILGMEERVRRLGGTLHIDSQPGQPTVVRAELPI
jgi:signal transduction histidine kinase